MNTASGAGGHARARSGATLLGIVGIVLWATETGLASLTTRLPAFEVTGLAFAAAALLSPFAWWISGDGPGAAFRQPWWVWAVTVPSLVAYHACIYFAVHRAPAAPAALLQGCTPLFIVFGSALLPGRRLRWWHVAGAVAGLEGLVALSIDGQGLGALAGGASAALLLIGIAAGLWGLYSLLTSRFGGVPTSAMGTFYAASAVLALVCHASFEAWVPPSPAQWAAMAALGLLPMGLALFLWDHGLKQGDVQALGVASYVEPLVGAGLVVAMGQGELRWSMLVSGLVIIGGAVLGAANAFGDGDDAPRATPLPDWLPPDLRRRLRAAAGQDGTTVELFVQHRLEDALRTPGPRRAV
ncbi:DMT family transporter [Lichenihabitans sp. Uapishka_5]|uniref:DMT family transporter n=1 Tax=Lichenihabitans sp. Uapishka_5 TaxID=3037302 RepID=UPI0029E7D9C6|nr:DMT family transporter [Lichenihabitans sp. Uapishka_5]MDX7952857.1 DMT family transporter [Lichenihabitans sp. Uapishka_5]